MSSAPVVLKFGGTSVGSPDRFKRVVEVVRSNALRFPVVVIASALSGVTDLLVEATQQPNLEAAGQLGVKMRRRHLHHAIDSLGEAEALDYAENIDAQIDYLARRLAALQQDPHNVHHRDQCLAAGERLAVSVLVVALHLRGIEAVAVDATELIRTNNQGEVDLATTFAQIRAWHLTLNPGAVPVVTGFIGGTEQGNTTTLGRGGSDYSAALFASALGARKLERWTDVPGIFSSDPRVNEDAVRFTELVLEDVLSRNQAGQLGMHRKALDPIIRASIPVQVRSIDQLEDPGTQILPRRLIAA